jgi:hypothetical protein
MCRPNIIIYQNETKLGRHDKLVLEISDTDRILLPFFWGWILIN